MSDIEVREFANGRCQVWKGNSILHPRSLSWDSACLQELPHMYFGSVREAKNAAKEIVDKTTVVKTHRLEFVEEVQTEKKSLWSVIFGKVNSDI